MRKAKFLKKVCAWMLTTATLVTSISPTGMVYASTDSGGDDTYTEYFVTDDENSDVGKVLLKINGEGGKVTVSGDDTGKHVITSTVNNDGEQVINVKDAADKKDKGEDTVVDKYDEESYAFEMEEEIGSIVSTEVQADDGYVIESYSVCSKKGKELEDINDISEGDTEYEHDVDVKEKDKVIEVSFVEDTENEEYEPQASEGTSEVDVDDVEIYEEIPEDITMPEQEIDDEVQLEDETTENETSNYVEEEIVDTVDEVEEPKEESIEDVSENQQSEEPKDVEISDIDGTELQALSDEGVELAEVEETDAEPRAGAALIPAGGKYLSEIFKIDREVYFDWLEYITDEDTSPYLGTKYKGGDFRNPKGDKGNRTKFRINGTTYRIPNNTPGSYGVGQSEGEGMNCTGLVWHALAISAAASGHPEVVPDIFCYAKTEHHNSWSAVLDPSHPGCAEDMKDAKHHYLRRSYQTKEDMMNSGVLEYGDIIFSTNTNRNPGNPVQDDHIGIYVGNGNPDTPRKYDRYLHCGSVAYAGGDFTSGAVIGHIENGHGGMISNIVPKTKYEPGWWTVIKMFPDEPDESNGKLRVHKKSGLPGIKKPSGIKPPGHVLPDYQLFRNVKTLAVLAHYVILNAVSSRL